MDFIKRITNWYFSKKMLPYWVILLADAAIVFGSAVFTYWIFNHSDKTYENHISVFLTAAVFAVLSWLGASCFKTYHGVLRYSSFVDLLRLVYANTISMVLALAVTLLFWWLDIDLLSPFTLSQIVVAFVFATMGMWAMRILVKIIFDIANSDSHAERALIYGALTGGIGLAKNIRTSYPDRFDLRGFISHEPRIKNMKLLGVKVYTLEDDFAEIIKKERIQAVLVTPKRENEFRNNQKLQDVLIAGGCKIYMVHDAERASIKDGSISEDNVQLKEVSVEDLLPRQEIRVDMKSVSEQLAGKRVLITGSAGSIGSEIVRQVAASNPASLMLIDQAETPQHDIRLMMARDFPDVPCEAVVASIDRRTRMEHVFSSFRPEIVFHAAAYKHVPMMEDNPSEAVLNNINGTKIIADLSVKYGAKKFVMISTDKAVNPTNVMGCTKRLAEIYCQSLYFDAQKQGKKTQFITTRFGNVLGSNGSVIPLFRKQIAAGGPVTVTHKEIIRYFMTIPEACSLVLEAGCMGSGGEIYIFDMGEPVKIYDLARRMISLAGLKPEVDIKIDEIGLRPGEKLYEELLNDKEKTTATVNKKIMIAKVKTYDYQDVCAKIENIISLAASGETHAMIYAMKEFVPEYKSQHSNFESIDKEIEAQGHA